MSIQVILVGGPKSGQLHELHERWAGVNQRIAFNVWPPSPLTYAEAEEQEPLVPVRQLHYRVTALPHGVVPGVAVYEGTTP